MKLCMLLDNPFHPIDRRVYQEAKTLVENGYDVTIVCKKDHENTLPESEIIDGIKIRRCFRYNLGTSVLVDKYLDAHFDLLKNMQENFDVYHCHDTETWPIGYIISQNTGAKFICDAHEYFPDYLMRENYPNEIKYETGRLMCLNRGQYIIHADRVITVGEKIAELLKEQYELSIKPSVIYNTRSIKDIVTEKSDILRQRFNIPADTKILLHHGNIERSRGIENILEALCYVTSNVIFLLAGNCSEDYYNELQQKVVSNGLEKRFLYIGFINPSELLQYVSSADVNLFFPFVYTKNMEYCVPNKFFEYIFAGTPFVISDLPEIAMLTERYNIGYVCKDVREMAEKIDKLLTDSTDYLDKKQNLRDTQQDLSWENQEDRLISLYKDLCK